MLSQVFSGAPNCTEQDFDPPAAPSAVVPNLSTGIVLPGVCGLS